MRICLQDAYDAVTDLNLWDYLKRNEFASFTYYHSRLDREVHDALLTKADRSGLHSGASYGITMRNMEYIAKHGFDAWKKAWNNDNSWEC
jgi:hypothetical protein